MQKLQNDLLFFRKIHQTQHSAFKVLSANEIRLILIYLVLNFHRAKYVAPSELKHLEKGISLGSTKININYVNTSVFLSLVEKKSVNN
jgi:hypothetical protein